eukprot:evm.model.scf_131.9 EVM.evm.TU.scf_131.9   scf_131:65137-66073(-)
MGWLAGSASHTRGCAVTAPRSGRIKRVLGGSRRAPPPILVFEANRSVPGLTRVSIRQLAARANATGDRRPHLKGGRGTIGLHFCLRVVIDVALLLMAEQGKDSKCFDVAVTLHGLAAALTCQLQREGQPSLLVPKSVCGREGKPKKEKTYEKRQRKEANRQAHGAAKWVWIGLVALFVAIFVFLFFVTRKQPMTEPLTQPSEEKRIGGMTKDEFAKLLKEKVMEEIQVQLSENKTDAKTETDDKEI